MALTGVSSVRRSTAGCWRRERRLAMRLKSEIWVKAYMRRCAHEGAAAVLVRRGDSDAGAIYIKVSRLDGTAALFGPAPAGLDEAREDRRWQSCLRPRDRAPRRRRTPISRGQIDFDSDIWIVAVEDRQGRHFLEDWLAAWLAAGRLRTRINNPLTPVAVK